MALVVSAALIGGPLQPVTEASAASASDSLTISVPETVDLGFAPPGEVAVGTIDPTTVTGSSIDAVDWTIGISVTPFTGQGTGAVIPAEAFEYTATNLAGSGMSTLVFDDQTDTVVATGARGESSASWSAEVALTLPADALADVYTATITTSVL